MTYEPWIRMFESSSTTSHTPGSHSFTTSTLIATKADGSVWELFRGADEWVELPPVPGTERARQIEKERGGEGDG